MQHFRNHPLNSYNTFGIAASAQDFYEIEDAAALPLIQPILMQPHFVLGGGSNILIQGDIQVPVIHMHNKGIRIIEDHSTHTIIEVNAGEVWHEFVLHTLEMGLGGLENLSLIPGFVGACPIQNIGAYGVEVKDVIDRVIYYDISTQSVREIENAACQFGYRDSIFKGALKGKCIITAVRFKLMKNSPIKTTYGIIQDELEAHATPPYSYKDVSNAVIRIRQSKLPDPAKIGNSGSFFKNPVIPTVLFQSLQTQYPNMPHFTVPDGIKVPAAYLIEQCGWKGFREKDYGVHQFQPLVLVNYGTATGKEIWELSARIIESVQSTFGITLEREVQII